MNAQVVPLQDGTPYDVVIIGFGPSGAVAACWLGQAGLRTLVIDKSRTIYQIPRAIAIDHEILRIFQNLGIAEDVLAYAAPFPASEHFGADGQLIRRIDVVSPPYPMAYIPTMVFTQPPVEAILRKRAASHPSVTISLGTEFQSLLQNDDLVTLELKHEDSSLQTVNSRYVIACDGASSRVRQAIGVQYVDLGFDEPWLVIDVKVNADALDRLPATAAQYCDPARPVTFIIGPGNHRRWEIMLLPGEDPRLMENPANVWALLEPWLTPQDGTLWRSSSYRFHALVADRWREGRVLLAGDAAHQQPPFIGQGMCQGLRDVTNITWKLESVLRDKADARLLDSYTEERRQHVYTLTSRIKAIGHEICELDPVAASRRDQALLAKGGGSPATVTRQEIVPPLDASIGFFAKTSHSANGTLFPQPWLRTPGDSLRMDEIVGHGWRVVLDGHQVAASAVPALAFPVAVIGGEGLQEQDAIVARWFERNSCLGAIVRPDHYVYGAFETMADLQRMIKSLEQNLYETDPIRFEAQLENHVSAA